MSEQWKFTPGEWYAVRHEHTLPESRKDCYRIDIRGNPVKVGGKTVASEPVCSLYAGFVGFEANAAAILALPALLAELRRLQDWFDRESELVRETGTGSTEGELIDETVRVKAILAQARGNHT